MTHNERYHKEDVQRRILQCPGERVIDEERMNSVYEKFGKICGKSLLMCGLCMF